jgi:repressor LexA
VARGRHTNCSVFARKRLFDASPTVSRLESNTGHLWNCEIQLAYHSDEWYTLVVPGRKLTVIQQRLLNLLQRRMESGEPPPTYREICSEFGWASTGTARDHLKALARKGYLQLSQGRARAVCLNEPRPAAAQVPLIGRIVAGIPVQTEECGEGFIPVPSAWVRQGSCFAVRVWGDSMKDAGILDGDQVVAKAQAVASEGDIVVATFNGETTLKRLTRRGSRWFLTPENKRYRPIPIQGDSAVIQGVMVGLLRSEPTRKAGLAFQPETKET